jgi:hypothetical protein
MKKWIVRGLLVGVLCVGALSVFPDQKFQDQVDPQLLWPSSVRELLHFASFVPETEESFVHIGGGFFAYFNRRDGMAEQSPELSLPDFNHVSYSKNGAEIRFSLRELGYESCLVYLPKGSLVLKTAEGRTLNFSMGFLDYLQVPGRQLPCYRLITSGGEEEDSQAILVCCALGTESPILVGTLYLVSNSGESICSYEIEITGRNNVEAENHLWKVVKVASRF